LLREGSSDATIARRTGVPRSTVRDWRRAHLADEPEVALCARCGDAAHDFDTLDHAAYAYLLGLYLGDGHVSATRGGSFRLRIVVDARHPQLAERIAATIARVHPGPTVGRTLQAKDHMLVVSQYARAWPCLLPQHGPGAKHLRRIPLAPWQVPIVAAHPDQLVRGLLHSDGCRIENRVRTADKTYIYDRYLLSNRSEDIRTLFCEALDRLEIPWRRMNGWTISIARREGVAALDRFVEAKA
jgi:hypothetical protein